MFEKQKKGQVFGMRDLSRMQEWHTEIQEWHTEIQEWNNEFQEWNPLQSCVCDSVIWACN